MMKNSILTLGVCGLLAACGDSSSTNTSTNILDYSACAQLPTGWEAWITYRPGCPGASGTWNNYVIVKGTGGAVISIDVYCGGTDADHYANQSAYNSALSGGATSNNDYVLSASCASGSQNVGGNVTTNLWRKTL